MSITVLKKTVKKIIKNYCIQNKQKNLNSIVLRLAMAPDFKNQTKKLVIPIDTFKNNKYSTNFRIILCLHKNFKLLHIISTFNNL